jgi:hypothetical protein
MRGIMQKNQFDELFQKHEIMFHRHSKRDDELCIDDNHILYEKTDQNYLCQVKDEVLCQIIRLQTTTELKSIFRE